MFLQTPPLVREIAEKLEPSELMAAIEAPGDVVAQDRYLHWDKLRRLSPPVDLTSEQWWLRLKLSRSSESKPLPLRDVMGEQFVFSTPDLVQRSLHRIDHGAGGTLISDAVVTSDRDAQRRYLVNSLEEEAIRSSQLEGAMTSRAVAKEMLRSGREPRDRGERMVANNYRAMQFMREEMSGPLSTTDVLELHRILSEGTLAEPGAEGRLQEPGEDRVRVFYEDDGPPIHLPPPAEELPKRLEALCAFANEGDDDEPFIHPVVRAILVHFWLAYDHPFLDGNGRTARILFFWTMRKNGYWLAEYLPISRLLRTAPAQYTRAFLETETDGGDTTYFLVQQLGVIEKAIDDLRAYLARKGEEQRQGRRLLEDVEDLNGRQVVLLNHALKHPEHVYTFGGHARSNRVTHETARADLRGLAERGFLARRRVGRTYLFEPAPGLAERLKESPK